MSFDREKLSGYLDGELTPQETREIELALETDPALGAELEQLMAADHAVKQEFDAMLSDPVPLSLASAVRNAAIVGEVPEASNMNRPEQKRTTAPWWTAVAAALALIIGGAGGYLTAQNTATQVATTRGWLADIADYHRVYSAQGRHLVEVPANEADHIETWLTKSVGANVAVPDLSGHGLEFRGARLLVAASKPVAQLMFTDPEGKVVALCLIAANIPDTAVLARQVGGFDMVTWGGENANFVVVASPGRTDLEAIAKTAAENSQQV